jgi:hypothetical protein
MRHKSSGESETAPERQARSSLSTHHCDAQIGMIDT